MKYIFQVSNKAKAKDLLEGLENLKEEVFLLFTEDDVKIFPYDEHEDQILVTTMKPQDAIKLIKLDMEQRKNKLLQEQNKNNNSNNSNSNKELNNN